ncbi:MAG: hypothetical protein HOF21_01590 [Nitrospina sp.]|nr:hypothetical protein [Nitrospina sp.]MBT5633537.1 hypothetical protein [Nitrospina sp.]
MASNQEVPTGDSVGNIFEVISLGHMSHYLQNWSLNFVTNTTMPLIYRAINFGAGIVSFYVLLGIVLIRIRRGSWRANRNGICILAFFYFPALIYGVLKPIGLHFWYSYIFLIPESLIIGFCVHSIFGYLSKSKSSVHRTLRVSFIALTLITFLLLNIMLINYTSQSVKNVEHAQPNLYTLMPHKNVQSILHSLMTSLSLSPDEFYQRVYTFDFKDTSGRMLRSPEVNVLENNGGSQKKKEKPCYLVKVKESKDQVMTELQYRRLEMFLKDSTINILSKEYVSMHKVGVSGIFEIYTYEPIFNQSCYYNNFNMFIVDKRIRDLVINAKDVLKSKEVVSIKAVMVTPKYNSNQELENLDGYYVIVHRISQNPFGFFLSIKRDGEDYLIRGTIQSIYFHRTPHPQPKTMDLIFRQAFQADPTDNLMKGPEGVTSRRNETRLNILSENTLASEANFPASPRSSYNQYWHREFKIPSQLIQGKQDVYLAWSQPVKVPDGPTRQSVKVEELEIKLSLNPT